MSVSFTLLGRLLRARQREKGAQLLKKAQNTPATQPAGCRLWPWLLLKHLPGAGWWTPRTELSAAQSAQSLTLERTEPAEPKGGLSVAPEGKDHSALSTPTKTWDKKVQMVGKSTGLTSSCWSCMSTCKHWLLFLFLILQMCRSENFLKMGSRVRGWAVKASGFDQTLSSTRSVPTKFVRWSLSASVMVSEGELLGDG